MIKYIGVQIGPISFGFMRQIDPVFFAAVQIKAMGRVAFSWTRGPWHFEICIPGSQWHTSKPPITVVGMDVHNRRYCRGISWMKTRAATP